MRLLNLGSAHLFFSLSFVSVRQHKKIWTLQLLNLVFCFFCQSVMQLLSSYNVAVVLLIMLPGLCLRNCMS